MKKIIETIQTGTFVCRIHDGVIGKVINGAFEPDGESVLVGQLPLFEGDVFVCRKDQLKPIVCKEVPAAQLKAAVRSECDPEELLGESQLLSCGEGYCLCVEDLYAGLKKIVEESTTYQRFVKWFRTGLYNLDALHFEPVELAELEEMQERVVLTYVFSQLNWLYELYESRPDTSFEKEECEESLHMMEVYLGDGDEHGYTEDFMNWFLAGFRDDEIRQAAPEIQQFFMKFLDARIEAEDFAAIERKAGLLFAANGPYAKDDRMCERLYCKLYEENGDPKATYCIGALAQAQQHYEKAFRFLSEAYAGGIEMAGLLMADQFLHGRGLHRNPETACRLVREIYTSTYRKYENGEQDTCFAEAAIRMGYCYDRGIDLKPAKYAAHRCFLEARMALKAREESAETQRLLADVEESLSILRQREEGKDPESLQRFLNFLESLNRDGRRIQLTYRGLKDRVYKVNASYLATDESERLPEILLSIEDEEYCELVDRVTFKTAPHARIESKEDGRIVYNRFEYDWLEDRLDFYLYETCTGTIISSEFGLQANRHHRNEE